LRFEGDEFVVFNRDSGLPDDRVDALALDRDGSLLVGLNQAVVRVQEDGQIDDVLGRESGLQSLVTSIAVDAGGGVWLTTLGDGVFFLDGGEVRQLTTADGLPTNQFGEGALVIDHQGTVWFGGLDGGLARYVP
jgi:ligand-binding sensor domain-containing protein